MLKKSKIFLVIAAVCGGLLVGACGGQEEEGEQRADLAKLGGKADIPEWLRHIPTNWGCDQKLTGRFEGFDSAHLYSFAGKIGYKYTFTFNADYAWYRGSAVAVYDAETGDRVGIERNPTSFKAKLVFEAKKNVKYLVAVYSIWWWATGDYSLKSECKLVNPGCTNDKDCSKGEYCKMPLCGQPKGATGMCTAIGSPVCAEIFQPVCGCNGKDYSNPCEAEAGGANVAHTGYCPTLTAKTTLGNAEGVIENRSQFESIFLAGCSPLALQKKEAGAWTDKGPLNVCFWEGIAQEVLPQKTWSNSTQPLDAGTYRFVSGYSIGCQKNATLSAASCLLTRKLFSDEFTIGKKQCWGAWLDPSTGACRTPADGVYPDSCCAKELDKQCSKINGDYVKTIADNQSCSLVVKKMQCQWFATSDLFCGSCARPINTTPDAAGLTKLSKAFGDLGCHRVLRMCPAYNCPKPAGANCNANDGSTTHGTCHVYY